jgi:phosphoribosylaminoimidazole carboxylase (NCAIR synthetase)
LHLKDGAFASEEELAGREHQQASQTWDLAPQVQVNRQREVLRRHEARLEEGLVMPKVGNKSFPYTKMGKMQAAAAAKKSGTPMMKKAKKAGRKGR